MAFSLDHLLESVIPAVITGGGTAVSTILAFLRDTKKRLDDVEKRVGSLEGKSGLVYSMHLLEDSLKTLRDKVGEPVRWRTPSFPGEQTTDFIEGKLRDFERRIKDLEECQERIDAKIKKLVSEDDFEQADRQRADEISAIRHTMAEVRGLLQGLQSALGLIGKKSR